MSKISKCIFALIAAFVIISFTKTAYNLIMHAIYPVRYYEYIDKYSRENNLDEYLVMGVIKAESNYIHDAHSGVARGLMQLTDDTAVWVADKMGIEFSTNDIEDPETNIKMGCFYLKYLTTLYENRDTALAAYNAGMGNVSKWLKNPEYSSDGITLSYIPFKETREYVAKVNDYERTYKELYDLGKNIKKRKSEAVNSSDGKE